MDFDPKFNQSGSVQDRPVMNGAPPEDVQLEAQLQERLHEAQRSAELHSEELARARRVITSCEAGLSALLASEPPAQPY